MTKKIEDEMLEAERNAWKSLAGYKFMMFGYWAGVWVHLNRVAGLRAPNPFRALVVMACTRRLP